MIANLLLLLGAVLLIGGTVVRQLLLRPSVSGTRTLCWPALGFGAAFLLLGSVLTVYQPLAALDMLTPSDLLDYLTSVDSGRGALLTLLGTCLLVITEVTAFSGLSSLGAAGLTLWGLAGTGHGAAHGSFVHLLHTLHAGAMCLWLGGLGSLLTLKKPQLQDAKRFSPLALLSVLVLAATGLLMTLSHAGNLLTLPQSSYGRTLLLKIGLFGLTLLVAVGVRRAFYNSKQVKVWLFVEAVFLLSVLAVSADLMHLPPPSPVDSAKSMP